MRQWCECHHSKAWHTEPPKVDDFEQCIRAINFLPIRGMACELCDCTGYVPGWHFQTEA